MLISLWSKKRITWPAPLKGLHGDSATIFIDKHHNFTNENIKYFADVLLNHNKYVKSLNISDDLGKQLCPLLNNRFDQTCNKFYTKTSNQSDRAEHNISLDTMNDDITHHSERAPRSILHNQDQDIANPLEIVNRDSQDDVIDSHSNDVHAASITSAIKPIGYNFMKWISDNLLLNVVFNTMQKQISYWFKKNDIHWQDKVIDQLDYIANDNDEVEFSTNNLIHCRVSEKDAVSNQFICHNTYNIINTTFNTHGNLLLLDLLIRTKSGVHYNYNNVNIWDNSKNCNHEIHKLAYSAYAHDTQWDNVDMTFIGNV